MCMSILCSISVGMGKWNWVQMPRPPPPPPRPSVQYSVRVCVCVYTCGRMGGDACPAANPGCFVCALFTSLLCSPLHRPSSSHHTHPHTHPRLATESLLWRAGATVWNKITTVTQDVKGFRISQLVTYTMQRYQLRMVVFTVPGVTVIVAS